ncbi:MAG: hypothetical protein ACRDYZ_11415 [Acidimicrobiales bacterium]
MRCVDASRNYGRNLVLDVPSVPRLDAEARADIGAGDRLLSEGLDALIGALGEPRGAP